MNNKSRPPEDDGTRPILTSSGAAGLLSVTVSALDLFERQGLLHPLRTENRVRLFLRSEIEALRDARALANAGRTQAARP
jgi:DNA-binding transcriptional MerR regulator